MMLLRKESDLRHRETEKEKNGSLILKLKWKKNGVYNKANLTSLFSKVIYKHYILNICLIHYTIL